MLFYIKKSQRLIAAALPLICICGFCNNFKKNLETLNESAGEPCQISAHTLGHSRLFLVSLHEKRISREMCPWLSVNLVIYLLLAFQFS